MSRSGGSNAEQTTAAQAPPSGASRLLALWTGGSSSIELPTRGSLVVGRSQDADVCIPHPSVSRTHARLHLGAPMQIEDLGSANGTIVDGARLAPNERRDLVLGCIVELGAARLVPHYAPDGSTSPMQQVFDVIGRVAASDISIVLNGETGAGKEVLAEAIHARSLRAKGPLLRLHCAALPENLLETELFGYERGAFTGATQAKPGLLEAGHRGTVLLDEIGEMPALTQAKLLRVLESREVLRVGALRPRPIDVRFIAATHRDLDVLVAMGAFRADLLFRLNGITIVVPPLRARASEIPALAATLLENACRRANRPAPLVSPDALALLSSYRWPGNVRELKNVLERAVLLSAGDRLDVEHITFGKTGAQAPGAIAPTPSAAPPPPAPGDETSERDRIVAALAQTGGNQKEAAKLLGITRRMLMYRLDKMSVPRPRRGSRE